MASEYFTLQETGTNASSTTETGSTLDGSYSRTQQGTDNYSITETVRTLLAPSAKP